MSAWSFSYENIYRFAASACGADPCGAAYAPGGFASTVTPSSVCAVTTPRRSPRTALVLLAAATTAAGAGAMAYSALHHPPAPPESPPQPAPPTPSAPDKPVVPDLVAAGQWRDLAIAACDTARWEECLADLDRARALDPAGDDAPLVKTTRDKAIKGFTGKRLK